MRAKRLWFPVSALVVVVALFQLFFRYEYISGGRLITRIDRLTSSSCTMPCTPEPISTPRPAPSRVPEAEQDQDALLLVKANAVAEGIVSSTNPSEYKWAVEGRKTADHGNIDWSAAEGSPEHLPLRLVCYCNKKGSGWRWEVNVDTRRVSFVEDNADLLKAWGF
jgi:hypothetical protein